MFRGETISNVKMPVRVGVDPEPRFSVVGLPNGVEIFASTSDHFFLSHKRAFCFDLIFLDGLHEAKQCYSDFVNVNRPGFVGDFILWKRGWNHGQTQQDRSKVFG